MTLRDIYLSDLTQLLDAARQKLLEWPILAASTESPLLREAFDQHYAQTRIHQSLIEGTFSHLDERPWPARFEAFSTVVRVWRTRHLESGPGLMRELSLITAALAMDHYTLPIYAEAITAAKAVGDVDGARTLAAAAAEEQARVNRLALFHDWLATQFGAVESDQWALSVPNRLWGSNARRLSVLGRPNDSEFATGFLSGARHE